MFLLLWSACRGCNTLSAATLSVTAPSPLHFLTRRRFDLSGGLFLGLREMTCSRAVHSCPNHEQRLGLLVTLALRNGAFFFKDLKES